MRLTKKIDNDYTYKHKDFGSQALLDMHQTKMEITDIIQKLGQLEDIEDELGIDLITLFKALKQETLFIKTDFDIRETIKNGEGWAMKHLTLEDGKIIIFTDIFYPNEITKKEWLTPIRLQLSDYGKTWALTKEELEMSKELTPLEAFYNCCAEEVSQKNYEIVETALKNYLKMLPEHEENAKKLKALEIIKDKKVYPSFLLNTKNLEEYNYETIQKLTQEEYNLLKEVLK